MKLARCSGGGPAFWAVVEPEADEARPIGGAFADWAPRLTRDLTGAPPFSGSARRLSELRLLPPVERTGKVVVAGANYAKHLIEFGVEPPKTPIAFLKAYGALIGATDDIAYPRLTQQLDHEVELVAVIGDAVDEADPLAGVLGYTVGNDVSSRDLQRSGPAGIGMDLFAAKSGDRTTPLGPWIVTRDALPQGGSGLRMTLSVDGDLRQDGSTADMTWTVAELIRFVQPRVAFEVGDILFTGTPHGVGQGTGRYLNRGELVEAEIERIGVLSNRVA